MIPAPERAPNSWGLGDGQAIPWEYAPAPEARDIVTLREQYGLFINGRFVPATGGDTFVSIDPATEQPLARVARATPADVDKAVRAARRAQRRSWGQLSGRERAKYLFRISRILQERSREFAVLESMDSGKPIKESRDVDVPLAASHFWYYAGWADKLDYAFPGRVARPLGVAAQIIPWNFPLLMLAWKIAPALAAGNTVVLKPASTTPLSAMLFAEVCVQADLPPGAVNIITGPGEIGMALATHPDVDKVAFTGSTEIGKKIGRGVAGTDKALTLELGGKAANIVFDDAPIDQAIEGIVNGIYFNQGEVCCAGSRLLVQESIAETVIDKLKDRLSTIRVGDPLDKNTDVGAINSKAQLEKITELVASRRRRGRRPLPAGLRPARPRLLLPPDAVHERRPEPPHRARGDLRAGAVRPDVPDAGRGGREGQQHRLRPVGGRVDRQGLAHPRDGVAAAGRRGLGQHVQPVRPDLAVRRLQGVRVRARGRHARPARVRAPGGPLMATNGRRAVARRDATNGTAKAAASRIEVRKTYKLYIGGAFPRSESGRSYLVNAADGTPLANACRASRKDVRDAVRAARKAVPGWAAKTAMNRGQVLYRVAELMEGRRDQFVAEVAAAEGLREPRARDVVDRAIDRWVWYAGWADKIAQVLGSSNPVAAPYFNFTIPEPTGVVGVVAPETSSLLGLVSRLAPPLVSGNTVVLLTSEARPLPAVTLSEVLATSDVPGRRGQHPDRAAQGAASRSSPRMSTSTPSTRGASRTRCASRPSSSPPTTSSACRVAPPPSTRPASTGSTTGPRSAPNGSPPSSR